METVYRVQVEKVSVIPFALDSRADIRRLRKLLQCHEDFMAHVKGRLIVQATVG